MASTLAPAAATCASPPKTRILALDGLRGLAISLVLWHHLVEPALPPGRESWLGWLRAGGILSWSGVDLFFVLSGFLIGGILIDHRRSPTLVSVFFARRAARILPLYFVTLAGIFLVGRNWSPPAPIEQPFWTFATFTANFAFAAANDWDWVGVSVLWSLAVEEQFYLAAPWLVRATPPRVLPWAVAAVIVTAQLARLTLWAARPDLVIAQHVLTPLRADALAWGILIAWIVRDPRGGTLVNVVRARAGQLLFVAAAIVGVITLAQPTQGTFVLVAGGYASLTFAYALIVAVALIAPPALVGRVLTLAPLRQLGHYSYALYLWHAAAGWWAVQLFAGENFLLDSWSSLALLGSVLLGLWMTAALSWRFFERPFLRLAHRRDYEPAAVPTIS
jgi:peptidoglycan/LPS O-acetylase OafA/YrhL